MENNYFYERQVYSKTYEKQTLARKLTEELEGFNVRALYYTDSVTVQFSDYVDVKEYKNVIVEEVVTKTLIREFVEDLDSNEVTIDTTDVDTIVVNHTVEVELVLSLKELAQLDDMVTFLFRYDIPYKDEVLI